MDPTKRRFRKMHKQMTKYVEEMKAGGWPSREYEEAAVFVQMALWVCANNPPTNILYLQILERRTARLAKLQGTDSRTERQH